MFKTYSPQIDESLDSLDIYGYASKCMQTLQRFFLKSLNPKKPTSQFVSVSLAYLT